MSRVYNFSAGPAVLPEEVLKEAADEMLDYQGCGMSVMEMSHRSKVYDRIIKEAEQDLRDLMNIHKVSEAEIRRAVAFRGFYPEDMRVASYDPEFIQGVLIAAWSQVYDVIKRLRN